MKGWKSYKLNDCVTLVSGGTPSKSRGDYWGGSIPWVSCKDMKVDRIYDTQDHLTELGAINGTRIADANTILIVVRGMILAKDFPVALTRRSVAFNQDLKAVQCGSHIDTEFLYYWFKASKHEILGRADEAGHGTKRIQTDRLLSLEIVVPPITVQRQIVSVLSVYDDLIEANERRIAILERMAYAIFREWFIDYRFPGHEGARMVRDSNGCHPKGWELESAADCILVNPTVDVPRSGEKPFVPMASLKNDSMLIVDVESRMGNSGAKFQNGDTLFARITPCLENGKTGFVQFLPSDAAVAFGSTEFIVLRSKSLCPEFVYLLARSPEFRENAIKSMTGASGRQRVQEACFDGYMVAVPPDRLISRFSESVSPMFRLVQQLHVTTETLKRARDLLLPRLILGKVAITGTEAVA